MIARPRAFRRLLRVAVLLGMAVLLGHRVQAQEIGHAQALSSSASPTAMRPVTGQAAPGVGKAHGSAYRRHHSNFRNSRARQHRVGADRHGEPAHAQIRVALANEAARMQPDRADYLNAIQHYPYADGALYQVYTAPGKVTDIALQDGEQLVGDGPVAAGDTVRWIIGDTASGSGTAKTVHILVKPTRPGITTNLVINTDRRTYHLELHSGVSTYMAAVSWTYPQDALIALRIAQTEAVRQAPVASGLDLTALNFRYRIDGDKPAWRPLRVFDDGRQAFIEFPDAIATGEMPPLFVVGADGSSELVNYRVQGRYMVVDRLFSVAELRLGTKKTGQRVRISRDGPHQGRRS